MYKNKIARSILSSYLIVLAAPFIASILVFFISLQLITAQIDEVNTVYADRMNSMLEAQLQTAGDMARSLMRSQYAIKIMNYKGKDLPHKVEILKQLQSEMIQQLTVNDGIEGLYAMFMNSNTVLTHQNVYYGNEFDISAKYKLHFDSSPWQEQAQDLAYRGYRLQSRQGDSGKTEYLAYFVIKNTAATEGADIIVIAAIRVDDFLEILNLVSAEEGYSALIADPVSHCVLGSGDSGISSYDEYTALPTSPPGNALTRYLSRSPVVSHSVSETSNWKYAFLVPAQSYLKAADKFLISMLVYLGFCLVGGAVVVLYLTRRQYQPIQRISNIAQSAVDDGPVEGYDDIEQALVHMLTLKQDSESRMQIYQNAAQDGVLRRILNGRFRLGDDEESVQEKYGLDLSAHSHIVSIYSIEGQSSLVPEGHADDEASLGLLVSILNSMESAHSAPDDELPIKAAHSPGAYRIYPVSIDGAAAVLINVLDKGKNSEDVLRENAEISRQVQEYVAKRLKLTLSVAMSRVHTGFSNIALAYSEAHQVAEYSTILGREGQIIRYDDLEPGITGYGQRGERAREQAFINCVRAQDYTNARLLLEEIGQAYSGGGDVTLMQAKLKMSGLVSATVQVLEEIRPTVHEDCLESIDESVEWLYKAKNISQALAAADSVLDELQTFSMNNKRREVSERDQRIIDYVKENFKNPDLNVTSISQELNISISYLSRIFKEATDQNLLDYIHLLRIEEAKALMREKKLTVKETAELVGYNNSLAMIRAFRRYEGITPSAYRDSFGKKG